MQLKFDEYKEKLMGCWMGKSIGGTLGAPFEGIRDINDINFYTQNLNGNPASNDDLDLQLVWLNAIERYGRDVNASILGEYWLSYIIPDWAEYGAGKNNLKMGFEPPLSGYISNPYKDSCGCFIRSEIWACIAPGHPEIAVKYAYEDAIVDHGDEGLYSEIFCAAMQSAAFIESDKYKLIDIGLSYIPEDCGVAKGITTAIDSYSAGVSYLDARRNVMTAVPGSFGAQGVSEIVDKESPIGEPGWDAPSNIGIMIIGWFYGEDDFGKSLCIAVNCGEDTDCTAATLGATLGIIHGYKGIPENWIEPIGETISLSCINTQNGLIKIPKTISDLTDRVLRLTPIFLGSELCDILAKPDGYTIEIPEPEELHYISEHIYIPEMNIIPRVFEPKFSEILKMAPFTVSYKFHAFNAFFDYMGEPFIKANESRKVKLTLYYNCNFFINQWLNIKWFISEGVSVSPCKECSIFLKKTYQSKTELIFDINTEYFMSNKIEMLISITSNGRHSRGVIPVVLYASTE